MANRDSALGSLFSRDSIERLNGARELEEIAEPQDYEAVARALSTERDRWVRDALERILTRLRSDRTDAASQDFTTPETLLEEVRARVTHDVASLFVHEIRPILGRAITVARQEIAEYESSQLSRHLERLQKFLDGVDRLRQALRTPISEEFELSSHIQEIAETESAGQVTRVELSGPTSLIVDGDPVLIDLVIRNGLRNAIEASSLVEAEEPRVVLSWGDTDRDYYVIVLDRGHGPPPGGAKLFEIGRTSKSRGSHLGMGLAIAAGAIRSLGGSVALLPREERGASFEVRWPKRGGGE